MSEKLLTETQVAKLLGLARNTITSYKSRGQMPEPDVVYGRTPLWKEATIKAWRPGGEER